MDRGLPAPIAGDINSQECWEVYQKVLEETKAFDEYLDEECGPQSYNVEGEAEAEWLKAAGLGELTEPWMVGKEVQPEQLGAVLRPLSRAQAEVVKRRVRSLNHTVRQRYNQRQRVRKPDIRDVFKDAEASSTGTRSRSATPDSLDSISADNSESNSLSQSQTGAEVPSQHRNVEIAQRLSNSSSSTSNSAPVVSIGLPLQEIFRRSGHCSYRGDVAGDSDGIELTAYQRLGTLHVPRVSPRRNEINFDRIAIDNSNDVDKTPTADSAVRNSGIHATVTRSHSSINASLARSRHDNLITHPLNRTSSHGHLSFEEMCKVNTNEIQNSVWELNTLSRNDVQGDNPHRIELLSQRELIRLQPLLWLELTSIFDKYNVPLTRRMPNKRRRKAGNLFGVSLATLILRDNQLSSEESNIPLVFQLILQELTNRGITEEGILRVGGHKQRVEMLCSELETDFYCKPKEIEKIFKRTPCHELSVVLKKLLRDLPQPLFTIELIDAFYQSHGVKNPTDLARSLNLLVLLLPTEHRCTLKALLTFLKLVIENQNSNKMSIHNVAMIVAPSLFPPHYIYPRDRTDLSAQVNMAAVCCQVTEAIFQNCDGLWDIPAELIHQLRRQAKEERYRKCKKKYC